MKNSKEWYTDRIAIRTIDDEKRKFTERIYRLAIDDAKKFISEHKQQDLLDALSDGTLEEEIKELEKDFDVKVKVKFRKSDEPTFECIQLLKDEALYDKCSEIDVTRVLKEYEFSSKSKFVTLTISKKTPFTVLKRIGRRLVNK